MGITSKAAARLLRAFDRASVRSPMPDLVWSGPKLAGLYARDTRRVYEELVRTAEQSLWISTFAFFDGRASFGTWLSAWTELRAFRSRFC